MRLPFLGVLDRYVLKQWLGTFALSAIGVPTVAVVIDLAEQFTKLTTLRGVPLRDIFWGQLYLFPSKISILIPAAVLFATVFTLNTMGRHSELTAVQGGGVSFYRLIGPILFLATLAVPLDFVLQELAGPSTSRHNELHRIKTSSATSYSGAFAFASQTGFGPGDSARCARRRDRERDLASSARVTRTRMVSDGSSSPTARPGTRSRPHGRSRMARRTWSLTAAPRPPSTSPRCRSRISPKHPAI